MICFLPLEKESSVVFRATDSDTVIGTCEFYQKEYKMTFTAFDCDDDIIAEGLARAAMNYGANRNAYIAEMGKELLRPAFIRLGFEGEEMLSVEIPQALSSGCSCGHK